MAVEVEVVGLAPEEVAGVGRRRPGGGPVDDSGRHATFRDQLGAEPPRPVATRLADEPGLDRTAGAERRQLPEPPRQGERLAHSAHRQRRSTAADCSGVSGTFRRRIQTRSPSAACWYICWYGFIISTFTLSNGPASISPQFAVGQGEDDSRVMQAVGTRDQVAPSEPEPLVGRQEDVSGLGDIRLDRSAQLPVSRIRGLAQVRSGHRGLREETRNQDSQERQAHP